MTTAQGVPPGPTAHVAVARLILDGLERSGGDGRELARRSGLGARMPAGPSARVPTECLGRLWRSGLAWSDDPCLGAKVAAQWRFGRLHLMDYLFRAAPTLAEAISELASYSALLNTAANEIWLASDTVTYQIRSGDPDVDAVATQFSLGAVLLFARHAAGRDIRLSHLGLAAAAPAHHRELVGMFGARRIDFGTDRSTMTLDRADLALPLPDADAPLSAVLRDHASSVIAEQGATPTWAGRVRQIVTAHLADGGPSLPAASRQLALSPRSLQRRLEEEGTTWREVVDGVRRDRAAALLTRGVSRTAVAARLGYDDTRVLRRALRRWGWGTSD